MQRFLFLLGSSRRDGNTERLARLAAQQLPTGVEQRWLRLDEHALTPFVDVRHDGGAFTMPEGPARELLDATLWATELVFVLPTYWYSLPASAKLYLDHWSAWLRLPVDFKKTLANRRLWLVTVNSDELGEDGSSEPLIRTLQLTAEYMHMRFGGTLIGHGNRPGDVELDTAAVAQAATFFAS
jgi:multimeric flavodoxin WrbA